MARYRHSMSPSHRWLSGKSPDDPSTWPSWLQEAYADHGRRLLARAANLDGSYLGPFEQSLHVPDIRDLDEEEWAQINACPVRRNEGEVAALRVAADRQEHAWRREVVVGVVAWIQGERRASPLTARVPVGSRPMLLEVVAEAAEADLRQPDYPASDDDLVCWDRHLTLTATIAWLIKASSDKPISPMPPVKLYEPIRLPNESAWSAWFADEVERLTAAGGRREEAWIVLTHPIVRTTSEIAAVTATLRRHGDDDALDVIAWACGDRAEAPWTHRKPVGDRPTRVEIDAEIRAIAAVVDSAEAGERSRERARTAGGALAWLVGNLDEEP
jgi:hypothetical protein